MAARTPLVGFNDNVEHLGQTYHIQTEDSAGRRCNVITHLFADGGRIVTSSKSSYKDYVEAPDADERVRELMLTQHNAMLGALRSGKLDAMLGEAPAVPAPPAAAPAAAQATAAAAPAAAGRGSGRARTLAIEQFPLDEVRALAGRNVVTPTAPVAALVGDGAAPVAHAAPPAANAVTTSPAGAPVPGLPPRPAEAPSRQPTTSPEVRGGGSPRDRAPSRPVAIDRRPTPATGGAYRFVGLGATPAATDEPIQVPPPKQRRFPQTNPGRLRYETSGSGDLPPSFPSVEPFGSRSVSAKRFDELVAEVLASLRP